MVVRIDRTILLDPLIKGTSVLETRHSYLDYVMRVLVRDVRSDEDHVVKVATFLPIAAIFLLLYSSSQLAKAYGGPKPSGVCKPLTSRRPHIRAPPLRLPKI